MKKTIIAQDICQYNGIWIGINAANLLAFGKSYTQLYKKSKHKSIDS